MEKAVVIEIEPTDFVDVADVSFPEFSEQVQQVCRQLATVEKLDQGVWSLFIDPAATIGDVPALARALANAKTDTFKTYGTIRMAAQYLPLKNLLSVPGKAVQKQRNFMLEATQLLNTVNNSGRELQPETRPLRPLAKVLDHAAGALVRLEALRVNTMMGDEHGDQYSRETVTVYYEGALRQVTDLTDREVLNQAREKADADTVAMLGSFVADKLVELITSRSREYVKAFVDAGHAGSAERLQEHFSEQPLDFDTDAKTEGGVPAEMLKPSELGEVFDSAGHAGSAEELQEHFSEQPLDSDTDAKTEGGVPAEMLKPSELGEVFDSAAKYVCDQAWAVMEAVHGPEKVIPEIVASMRELMVSCFRFQPERRRHQDNPRLGLTVVSLDKVAGNANLKDLYVRVHEDGQLLYVEDFEDGKWLDLFQLREYKPARLATAAKKKADEEDTEMLQTGRKYMCTVGRAKQLFGESAAEVINGCFRGDDGETKIFDVFSTSAERQD